MDFVNDEQALATLSEEIQILQSNLVQVRQKWDDVLTAALSQNTSDFSLDKETVSMHLNLAYLDAVADWIRRFIERQNNNRIDGINDLFRYIGMCYVIFNPSAENNCFSVTFQGQVVCGNTLLEAMQNAKLDMQQRLNLVEAEPAEEIKPKRERRKPK